MISGGIATGVSGIRKVVTVIMSAIQNKDVLEKMLPSAQTLVVGHNWYLQNNNFLCHHVKTVKGCQPRME
jgi:hypothetical protein